VSIADCHHFFHPLRVALTVAERETVTEVHCGCGRFKHPDSQAGGGGFAKLTGQRSDKSGIGGDRVEPNFGEYGMDRPSVEDAQRRQRAATNPPKESGSIHAKGKKADQHWTRELRKWRKHSQLLAWYRIFKT